MMTPALAHLVIDGTPRQVCVGCTQHLAECAMVTKIDERDLEVLNVIPAATFSVVTYEIAAPYTLEQCRAWVADRHRGDQWGGLK